MIRPDIYVDPKISCSPGVTFMPVTVLLNESSIIINHCKKSCTGCWYYYFFIDMYNYRISRSISPQKCQKIHFERTYNPCEASVANMKKKYMYPPYLQNMPLVLQFAPFFAVYVPLLVAPSLFACCVVCASDVAVMCSEFGDKFT